ncbi:hypothetical protein DSCO28_36480 [Desulfosarcina ovata subsp. sediminis]|uniref:Flagellar assembly protein T N-terminal domain-containing protein n=1 Tax=Desulfosarcina ovata subsp. sediminis TaxID=885957 RepID=A0A5K7ZS98_9BACT|nr:flagellar assembly protein T N-terminal domain-containing protein [Desulfosarcina ovata]BBO83082.1 hypothetical protein DSCO28_36480 [Desulfosarcina ovata subsp. sediminis]
MFRRVKTSRYLIISFLLTILYGITTPLAFAEEKINTVTATGVAAIQGDNIQGARENAIQDALRQALEQGVETLMEADTTIINDDLLEQIHTHAKGYFTGYNVLKEKQDANGLYRVKVRADVKTSELMSTLVQLGLVKQMMDYPRVMFIPHPGNALSDASKSAEDIFIKIFSEKKFDIVDPTQSKKLHGELAQLFKTGGEETVAAKIGLEHHAEIVYLYTLNTSDTQYDGIMENVPVELRVRAIVTTTAQILAAEVKNITGVGQTPEMACIQGTQAATEKACQSLMTTTVSWWADYTANGLPYTITLKTPPKSMHQIIAFQEAIESIPGVMSLTERSSGGGITEMMVKYKYDSAQLKRNIVKKLYGVNGFEKLDVPVSKGRFMVLSLI